MREYATKDLALAAYLIEVGHKLTRLEPAGRLKQFVFAPEAEGDVQQFFNGAKVSARSYSDTLRSLKASCNPR